MIGNACISILHEPSDSEPFLVLFKPRGLPSAPLNENDESAYTQAEKMFPILHNVVGKKKVEHGLIHRIDTDTEGLLLIASSQNFYTYMQGIQKANLFFKTYRAVCNVRINSDFICLEDGFPESPCIDIYDNVFSCTVRSRFRPYGIGSKEVRPVVNSSGKAALKKSSPEIYETSVNGTFNSERTICNVSCVITKGYRHQVRCHLAWIGLPIKGDPLYSKSTSETAFYFTACGLRFPFYDGREMSFSL
ncbi:MAG: hypothetical protein K6G00_13185 [Treponema sp.]|nr:hypothetical protein [Treponema sp.]